MERVIDVCLIRLECGLCKFSVFVAHLLSCSIHYLRKILKSTTIIASTVFQLNVSIFRFVYLGALLLGTYMFITVTRPLTAIFIKGSSLSLTIVPYFCLIWQSRALCIVYAFNLHSIFFLFFCYQILCIFWLMCNFYHCFLCFLPAPQSTFWPNSLTQLPLMLLLK